MVEELSQEVEQVRVARSMAVMEGMGMDGLTKEMKELIGRRGDWE
jgi:hypothetical protein